MERRNVNKITLISILFLALCGLFFYGSTLRGIAGNIRAEEVHGNLDEPTKPFELSPERGRYAHISSMAEDDSYALSKPWADAVYPDVGYYEEKFYSFFAPGISYLALPFYKIGANFGLGQIFTFALISLASIGAMIFIFKIAREVFSLPLWASLFAPIVFAFGSTAWSYAITLYQHHLTTFFIVASFYAVWKYREHSPFSWAWASFTWINYALAIFIDYPNVILMLPVMLYFCWSSFERVENKEGWKISLRWASIVTFVFFIMISGAHAYHNAYYFGSWKNLSGGIIGYKIIKEEEVSRGSILTPDQIKELQTVKDNTSFFTENYIPHGFYTLLFSTDRGLFFYAPIFLIAFFGIFASLNRIDATKFFLILAVGTNIFLYSSWGDPLGRWAYGPRYLIPSMAILSIFAADYLARAKFSLVARIFALVLFIYSSAVALLGALTTNAVPPKIEGDFLGMEHNFLYNMHFFSDGKSGSFMYNTYFSHEISLQGYFIVIYSVLFLIMCAILFILPYLEKKYAD